MEYARGILRWHTRVKSLFERSVPPAAIGSSRCAACQRGLATGSVRGSMRSRDDRGSSAKETSRIAATLVASVRCDPVHGSVDDHGHNVTP